MPLPDNSSAPNLQRVIAKILSSSEGGICPEVSPEDEMFTYPIRLRGASAEEAAIEYFRIGRETFAVLDQILCWAGGSWQQSRALDFASGYGRVSRFLADALADGRLTISDILAPAVSFQVEHLRVAGFVSKTAPRWLDLCGPYEFVSAISLFSHLPDRAFRAWLKKLSGALAHGGIMVFTTAGEHAFSVTESAGKLDRDFLFWRLSESRTLKTRHYGKSFCRPRYVQRVLDGLPDVDLLAQLPHALNDHQDIYVIGRCREAPSTPCVLRPMPKVHIDVAEQDGSEGLRAEGWALQETDWTPVRRVALYLDDRLLGDATLGHVRPDLEAAFESETAREGGWAFRGQACTARARWLTARVEDQHGQIGFATHRLG